MCRPGSLVAKGVSIEPETAPPLSAWRRSPSPSGSLLKQLELQVSDEGPGFPVAFLPHAFERFSRAEENRSRGGAGLGLAIVEAVARAHGGKATVKKRPQGGALVRLSLQLATHAAGGL